MTLTDDDAVEDDLPPHASSELRAIHIGFQAAGERLDKALAVAASGLSRGRVQALMAAGAVSLDGRVLTDCSAKALAGEYELLIPPPTAAAPMAEDIALQVLYEDDALIVVDKPAGMAVHPAPGNESGTLVNALLHHCRGGGLAGIGGVARPGIVHRIDMDTSGVLVAAKTDAAHAGLSALFAAHDIDRVYIALTRNAPKPGQGDIVTRIGRSPHDRKKMAVLRSGGREAITHYRVKTIFGDAERPALASEVSCTLETGRTHQIRVHLASKGAPCLGDPVYGSGQPSTRVREAVAASGLDRQALHASVLGFRHPITGEPMRFEAPLPADMTRLMALLQEL